MKVASRKKITLTKDDLSKIVGQPITSIRVSPYAGNPSYAAKQECEEISFWVEVEESMEVKK